MADLLASAVQSHQQGRREEAERLYRQVLEAEPKNPEALHLLGLLRHEAGDNQAAAKLIREAVAARPDKPSYHFNLGVVLTVLGDLEGAADAYREVVALTPEDADGHSNLGLLLLQQGKRVEAAASFRAALKIAPKHLGAQVNLGRLLLAEGRPDEAAACFDAALELAPGQPEALLGRGEAFAALQMLDRAERDFRALLQVAPDQPAALGRLAGVLIQQARLPEAIELLERGAARFPEDPRFPINLAAALEARNDLEGAERAARKAEALRPGAPAAGIMLARLENRRGRPSEAKDRLQTVLSGKLAEETRSDALFELGQALDKLDEAPAAYAAFLQANALQLGGPAGRRIDGGRFLKRVDANRSAFTAKRLRDLLARAPAYDGPSPVFFVGFPRSGTTLMERALAAHPQVLTSQERSPLVQAVRHLVGREGDPIRLDGLAPEQIAEARGLFWSEAEKTLGPLEGRLLVDKLPLNLVDLGYANLLFPGARVLVALRDPRDIALSCFMQRFRLNSSMINFCSLERTAETYATVMDLWLAYREALSLPWQEYRYEDLLADFEGVVRSALAFMGLDWHEAIAGYREKAQETTIATPSYRQVTGALHKQSLERWRRYEKQMKPVLPTLTPFAAAFGYPEA